MEVLWPSCVKTMGKGWVCRSQLTLTQSVSFLFFLALVYGSYANGDFDTTANETVSTLTQNPDSELPYGWEEVCTKSTSFVEWNITTLTPSELRTMTQISCFLNDEKRIYLKDFRSWQVLRTNKTKVALKVICDSNSAGYFHLPWPMKARNLVYLEVKDCLLPDYYLEYYDPTLTTFADELRVLDMQNCKSLITMDEFILTSSGIVNTSIPVECGPLTLEKWVIGETIEVEGLDMDYLDNLVAEAEEEPDLGDLGEDLYIDSRRLQAKVLCEYQHLRYLEDNSEFASGYLKQMLGKSLFHVLETYNLSNAGFIDIPKEVMDWRAQLRKLKYLDLSYNHIKHIQFYGPGDGGVINLQFNSISVLTKRDFESFDRVKSAVIDIRNNPINCSCDVLVELYSYLKKPDLGPYEYLREMQCASPPSLRGRKVGSFSKAEIVCKEPLYALIGILSVCVLVLFCIIIVLVRYRKEVLILVYTRLHIILPCANSVNEVDKEYDAFISYSSKDERWVLQTLVKNLEKEEMGGPLRLCVHHRDFELGAAISENVVKSVEQSRHTIMVLSRNYVQSEWCIYEFRTALYQSIVEKRKHLIVIILEDIPKQDLDPDLRKCLDTFTYITVADSLFWDRILYALTVRSKRKSSRIASSSSCGSTTSSSTIKTECPETETLKTSRNNNIVISLV